MNVSSDRVKHVANLHILFQEPLGAVMSKFGFIVMLGKQGQQFQASKLVKHLGVTNVSILRCRHCPSFMTPTW